MPTRYLSLDYARNVNNMKTYLECVPCFAKQALEAGKMVTQDINVREKIMRKVLEEASAVSFSQTPAHMGQVIHRVVKEISGNPDPYRSIKQHFNTLAMSLYPGLKNRLDKAPDRFQMAVRLAIAGNIIDFNLKSGVDDIQLFETIEDTLKRDFAHDHTAELKKAIDNAASILYIGDNAGEIVFDRILIEELTQDKVTYVVRGYPIINDATLADAKFAGITELVRVIENGSDAPGTILEDCSKELRQVFDKADLVIAKGQGNYETLNEVNKNIFFLLRAKCPVIARDTGCKINDIIVWKRNSGSVSRHDFNQAQPRM